MVSDIQSVGGWGQSHLEVLSPAHLWLIWLSAEAQVGAAVQNICTWPLHADWASLFVATGSRDSHPQRENQEEADSF